MHGWLVVMYSCLKSISMQGWTETQRPEDGGRRNDRAAACKGGRKTARYSKLIVRGERTPQTLRTWQDAMYGELDFNTKAFNLTPLFDKGLVLLDKP